MAVGLGPLSTLHPVPGFELGIASAGIKRPGRKDVVVMRSTEVSATPASSASLAQVCAAAARPASPVPALALPVLVSR